jgi:hypothetical protein
VTLPSPIAYGTVKAKLVTFIVDTADVDATPDQVPVTGQVRFVPSAPLLLAGGATPTTVITATQTYNLDSSGVLRDAQGRDGVTLVATDSAVNPTGWTWTAHFLLHGGLTRAPFSFTLPAGSTVDLTTVAPVTASNGVPVIQGPPGPPGDMDPDLFALRAETPTLEELERVVVLGTASASTTARLGVVSMDQRIGGLTVGFAAAVAASDINFWTVGLYRFRAGASALLLTSRTTRTTGGEAILADQGWHFDAAQWLETARHVRKGDVLALVLTKTGTPADLASISVAIRYEPNVVPAIRDSFTRTDSTTSLGVTDTGQTWVQYVPGFGISNGQAYAPVAAGDMVAVIDSGLSDCTFSVRYAVMGASVGVIVRAADANNLWLISGSGVFKRTAGVYSGNLLPTSGWATGDTVTVVLSGPTITVYRNGVAFGTVTDAYLQDATRHGIRSGNDTIVRFDDLAVAA